MLSRTRLLEVSNKEYVLFTITSSGTFIYSNNNALLSLCGLQGQILLLENSRSTNPLLGVYQDMTADAAASMGGKGCVYNQDVSSLLRAASINIQSEGQYAAGVFRSFVCTVSS